MSIANEKTTTLTFAAEPVHSADQWTRVLAGTSLADRRERRKAEAEAEVKKEAVREW